MARPSHIEEYLCTVRVGQWFGWTDSKNKVYANLIVHDGGTKPTESAVDAGLKSLQDRWDAEFTGHRQKRREQYPRITDQLDLLYQDILAGKVDATGEFAKAIKKVKDDNPKS